MRNLIFLGLLLLVGCVTKPFNGKNLTGWNGNPAFWSAKDGTITGQTTKENPTK